MPEGKNPYSTVFWNRAGVFVETDRTAGGTSVFTTVHSDQDVQSIDIDQDGLPDLVLVGESRPGRRINHCPAGGSCDFVNRGSGRFADETADRIPPGKPGGGVEGETTTDPLVDFVRVLRLQPRRGRHDFARQYGLNATSHQEQPLVWLNDGTGHFTTLKVGDFVRQASEALIDIRHLAATRNGYNHHDAVSNRRRRLCIRGLNVFGLLATKPYRITSVQAALRH